MTSDRATLDALVTKYGARPGWDAITKQEIPDCWSFTHNKDCRAFAAEARALGWQIWDVPGLAGILHPGDAGYEP